MSYGKIWFCIPGKCFLKKRVIAKTYHDLVLRARREWNTNKKLRTDIRKYMKEHFPNATHMSIGLGWQQSYVNPMRNSESFDFTNDRWN